MRRSVPVLACVFFLIGTALPALSRADLDKIIDPSVTLKTLSAVADGKASLSAARMVLLTGTVSDVSILDKEEESFRVRIELITGEWIKLEDVKSYACYVEFSGPEYFKVFPARAPREATPGVIATNSRVVIIGKPLRVVDTPLGAKHVLVEGVLVRVTE
jgi:hypothetical protein